MENNIQTENNLISTGKEKKPVGKIEKIILIVLAMVFVSVLVGAAWDLYGRKAMTSYLCTSQNTEDTNNQTVTITPANTNPSANNQGGSPTGQNKQPAKPSDSSIAYSSYSTCLENTKDGPTAKDCCDCLSADESVRKACRDATVSYDFSKNTTFKQFTIPSKLGRNGDYSAFTASGSQAQCKQACESASSGLACGDYQYCRTACNGLPQ
jgi:cytoskeletal protein RodZ